MLFSFLSLSCAVSEASQKSILIFGDEAVSNLHASEGASFDKILSEKAFNILKSRQINFVNLSSSEMSPYLYNQYFDKIVNEHNPEIIIYVLTKALNLERELRGRYPLSLGCPFYQVIFNDQKSFAAHSIEIMTDSLKALNEKSLKRGIKFITVVNLPIINQQNYMPSDRICRTIVDLKARSMWTIQPSDIGIKLTLANIETVFSNEFRKVYWQEVKISRVQGWADFRTNYTRSFTNTLFPWLLPFLRDEF